jgi:diguanylate cyclase (GGDEF)-like protein/PAS domain S-box-containing protein
LRTPSRPEPPDAVLTTDERGLVADVDGGAEALFGLTRAKLLGRPVDELLALPASAVPAPVHGVTTSATRADGTRIRVAVCVAPTADASPRLTVWVRDLSGQTASERRDVLLARVEEVAEVGSWAYAPDTRELLWSDNLYRLLGLEPGAITARPESLLEQVHPDDRERVEGFLTTPGSGVGRAPLEYRIVTADGSVRHLLSTTVDLGAEDPDAERLVVGIVQDVTARRRAERDIDEHLAEQRFQARLEHALAEVAAAVARGEAAEVLFRLVAERLAAILDAPIAAVLRYAPAVATRVAASGLREAPVVSFPLDQPSVIAQVWETGEPARVDDYGDVAGDTARQAQVGGWRSCVGAPVRVEGRLWGCLTVASPEPHALPAGTERLVERFAALVATALANADARARLEQLATTDGLTGLANHRAFQERLRAEHRQARRHDRPLALAVFDLDGFKGVNDEHGHQQGDHVLAEVGRAFAEHVRDAELAARVGGDEFAVIAPDADATGAFALAERLRAAVEERTSALRTPVRLSAGVVDLRQADDVEGLLRLADRALYWAKHRGRDITVLHTRDDAREPSAQERDRLLQRTRALYALRALARTVDAADGAHEHAGRVGAVAETLALRLGWASERAGRLREAGLLHDVGKIAVPDAVLSRPGPLNPTELSQVALHVTLGARIVEDVLDDEQVAWIRGHHERLDGEGYPDGLAGDAIPDGARLLAVAEAYDAMTTARRWRAPRDREAALAELRRWAGRQFDPAAVDALAAGLPGSPARHAP